MLCRSAGDPQLHGIYMHTHASSGGAGRLSEVDLRVFPPRSSSWKLPACPVAGTFCDHECDDWHIAVRGSHPSGFRPLQWLGFQ